MITSKVNIGIPKGLMYYEHGELWEEFFNKLGCNVIKSPDTNKTILDLGVKHCSNETCLPVKVFHGHVIALKDKVDYVFIPRYITLEKNTFSCPKLCALPDMTFLNIKDGLKIIEIKIDAHNGFSKTKENLEEIANILDLDPLSVEDIYKTVIDRKLNNASIKYEYDQNIEADSIIVVLGHPYMIYDKYLNMNLIKKLLKKGLRVVTPADLEYSTKRVNSIPFQERDFWSIGYENLGSALYYATDPRLCGIIYLTPFACGIDSVVTEFIERRIKNSESIHYMKLTMDEHSGEAGFDTRLEAFFDMVIRPTTKR